MTKAPEPALKRRFMSLKDLILEIFKDFGIESSFDELTETDQRRLCAAYLRENEEVVLDLLVDVHRTSLAQHIADLIDGDCDVLAMAHDIKIAAFRNKELISLVEGEMDWQWRMEQKFKAIETPEAHADAIREAS